ncbi:MAG: tRNA (cytidine(34)-2'-O)-methyltransferase [Oscillospiraceae bacterium]
MAEINIVLLEPQIPQNTGNIARTCAATNVRLHLVGPMGFCIDDKQLKRAGLDYWHMLDISFYENTIDFFEKNKDKQFIFFTTKAEQTYSDISYSDGCYIVFGREDKGIAEELLCENEKNCVRIPMISNARSLNLSNTVAIATYEILRQWNFPQLLSKGSLHNLNWRKNI